MGGKTEGKVCIVCGEPLKGRQTKYCSRRCNDKRYYNDNKELWAKYKKPRKNKNCKVCGKPLPKWKQSYCSEQCIIRKRHDFGSDMIRTKNNRLEHYVPEYCDECGGQIVVMSDGEYVCKKCGLVY